PALLVADLWLPVTADERLAPELANHALERRDLTMFQVVGRLRPGVTEAGAQAELGAAAQQLEESYGDFNRRQKGKRVQLLAGGRTIPLRKQDLPFFREFFMVLGSLVLLIACANIANMMLARAAGRRREIAVRLAMGASRARLVRQLLTESTLLAAGAVLPAFLLSVWLMHLLSQLRMPLPIPVSFDLSPDWRALVFAFAVTGLTGLLFGIAPARQAARTDLQSVLKEGSNILVRRYRSFSPRNALVLCQMAASLMLLLLTGYMGLGIQSTLGVQEGFDPRNLYLISLDPVRDGYSGPRAAAFFETLLTHLRTLRSIASVCLTDTLPASTDGNPGVRLVDAAGKSEAAKDTWWAKKHIVGRGYFETAGIRILSGRSFQRQDEANDSTAVIVSQTAVRLLWNGADPVGRRIAIANDAASGGFGAWPGTFDLRASVLARETAASKSSGWPPMSRKTSWPARSIRPSISRYARRISRSRRCAASPSWCGRCRGWTPSESYAAKLRPSMPVSPRLTPVA
ncbi:MAG TPA: FtsX-like permease family protein, partial [Candidatus Sulfopaludibacter sp.]|nr:FtsX-like permease family protein [Candidatus Sulfopaludibacter sp.]